MGDKAPDFVGLLATDGKKYSLSSLVDVPILVFVVSCNHCPYVQAYEDRMIAIQGDYKDRGVGLVAVNSNYDRDYPEDSYENMVKRARMKEFNFPYIRDETQSLAKALSAVCTPEVFVFDIERRLVYHGRIDDNKDPDKVTTHDLRNALDAITTGKKPAVTETRPFGCSVKWRYD
ncbi:thioredoxin family protein [[Eubacterium] cellulosolvens]